MRVLLLPQSFRLRLEFVSCCELPVREFDLLLDLIERETGPRQLAGGNQRMNPMPCYSQ